MPISIHTSSVSYSCIAYVVCSILYTYNMTDIKIAPKVNWVLKNILYVIIYLFQVYLISHKH